MQKSSANGSYLRQLGPHFRYLGQRNLNSCPGSWLNFGFGPVNVEIVGLTEIAKNTSCKAKPTLPPVVE